MKIFSLISILFFCSLFKAQNWQPIYYADYSYANRNQIKAGLEWFLSKSENDNKIFFGTGFNAVYHDDKIHILPDLHFSYNSEHGYFLKTGSSFSHAYTLGGVTFLNAFDLGVGYSVPYQKNKMSIKGFTVGITIRLTNNDRAYGKLKIGF